MAAFFGKNKKPLTVPEIYSLLAPRIPKLFDLVRSIHQNHNQQLYEVNAAGYAAAEKDAAARDQWILTVEKEINLLREIRDELRSGKHEGVAARSIAKLNINYAADITPETKKLLVQCFGEAELKQSAAADAKGAKVAKAVHQPDLENPANPPGGPKLHGGGTP
jgi:hypothetical protein